MKFPSIIIATTLGLILGVVLESDVISQIGFVATGLGAGAIAQTMPRGAERPYWLFVLVVLILLGVSYFGAALGRLWFILPIVFVISYTAARIVLKFQRRDADVDNLR